MLAAPRQCSPTQHRERLMWRETSRTGVTKYLRREAILEMPEDSDHHGGASSAVDKKTPKKSKKGGYKKMSNVIEGVGSFDLVLVDPTGDGRREAISLPSSTTVVEVQHNHSSFVNFDASLLLGYGDSSQAARVVRGHFGGTAHIHPPRYEISAEKALLVGGPSHP